MKKGTHFDETFAPYTRLETIHLLCAISTQKNWRIRHADVPNTYLHGKNDKLIFTRLPLHWNRFVDDIIRQDDDIIVLDKTLYGAPHAGRQWNHVIDQFL